MVINPPKKVCVKLSPIHGYGVFASDKINSGEVIEECPILDLGIPKGEHSSCLLDYRYNWPKSLDFDKQVVAWGYGSLYNHSTEPNADWRENFENGTFEFYATKDINVGEEIFIYYGGVDYWNDGRNHVDVK